MSDTGGYRQLHGVLEAPRTCTPSQVVAVTESDIDQAGGQNSWGVRILKKMLPGVSHIIAVAAVGFVCEHMGVAARACVLRMVAAAGALPSGVKDAVTWGCMQG